MTKMVKKFKFYKAPNFLEEELHSLKTKPASFWEKKGERLALALLRFAGAAVPAYKKFLKKHRLEPEKIKTISDFKKLPVMDKDNYLRASAYEELFPSRDLSRATTISATSGSTGEPFYFPRGEEQDAQYQYVAELFLRNQFAIDKYSTLGIIGFGLGIWIGGIFTYKNFNAIARKGYKLTLAPVGTNKELFLKTLKKFGADYDQVILMGYPPFIKDVLDDAAEHGVNLKDYRLRILCAAEGFSERFREYVASAAHLENAERDIINIYGTVELGTMAHETAASYLIRKLAFADKKLGAALFPGAGSIPTLAQYYPQHAYFEQVEREVIGTGCGSLLPLLRYRFRDVGGVISYDEILRRLRENGVDWQAELAKAGIKDLVLKLPFVYVVERSDNSIVLRGANINASEIKNALDEKSLSSSLTGKFCMIKKEDRAVNQKLTIHIELKKSIKMNRRLKKKILAVLIEDLCKNNIEFRNEYTSHPHKATPLLKFWPYKQEPYFNIVGKQKWVVNKQTK